MMKSEDMKKLLGEAPGTFEGLDFAHITADSRQVKSGSLFVALKGETVDGHDYLAQAKANGAVAVMGEREDLSEIEGLPYIRVSHAMRSLGLIAHHLQGDPSKDLKVIGVTGTNGKSSTVFLIRRILEHCGCAAAQFGTLGYSVGNENRTAPHTTPFPEELAALFQWARESGQTHVVMEASSHALAQERVAGIDFDAAVFTNLTQDHLDYHDGMEGYLLDKLRLFDQVQGPGKFTVVNNDDPNAHRFIEGSRVPCITYGEIGDCRGRDIEMTTHSTSFEVRSPWGEARVTMSLLGKHNVSNALAAIATCGALGLPLDDIAEGVASLPSVPGRFEHVDAGQKFQVIVDYAHTEDGLVNVLRAAQEICKGRVIVVFGCGGDRDKDKRPKMAAAAAKYANFCILTSDNPRTESPERILLDVEVGLQHAGKKRDQDYLVFLDRAEAIQEALSLAKPEDLVMIAGKGHEDYQILNTERIHFDDREVARNLLEAM